MRLDIKGTPKQKAKAKANSDVICQQILNAEINITDIIKDYNANKLLSAIILLLRTR